MNERITAASLCALLALPAGAKPRAQEELVPKKESWSTLQMEAKAVMGELKYQHGDLAGARDTFRDSLNSSTQLMTPHGHVVGLDLFRTAELAARRGDVDSAREHLELLLSRYPDSEFAENGRRLMDLLPRLRGAASDAEAVTPVLTEDRPEFTLSRVQDDLRSERFNDAESAAFDFLTRFPDHASASELRLLYGALLLRRGQASLAVPYLRAVARGEEDPDLRAKAVHLLGAALVETGRHAEALEAVRETDPAASKNAWLTKAQLWRAAALSRLGRAADSARVLRSLLAAKWDSPTRTVAMAELARFWEKRGRPAEALAAVGRVLEEARRWGQDDSAVMGELSEAHMLYRLKRFDAAAAAYGRFVLRHPKDPQTPSALFQKGLSLKRLGRPNEALAAFAELARTRPDSVHAAEAHLQMGQLYSVLGREREALAAYSEFSAFGQAQAREGLLLSAQLHYNRKDYKDAIPLYWRFLEASPGDPREREVQDLLLTSYWLGPRRDPRFAEALALYPSHPIAAHARWELGAEAFRRGDYDRAIRLFDRYASDHPRSPRAADALYFLAESRMKQGDFLGAAASFAKFSAAHAKDPRSRHAAFRRGEALFDAGDFPGAARAYDQVRGTDRLAADALINRALASRKAQDPAGELAGHERFLRLFPKHSKAAWAWFQTARLREDRGLLGAAAEAYAKIGPGTANSITAAFALGRIREKLKQNALALKAYESLRGEAPAADPTRLRGLLRLGLLLELQGQPLKALKAYAEVMRSAPRDSPDFNAARQRVQELTAGKSLVQAKTGL